MKTLTRLCVAAAAAGFSFFFKSSKTASELFLLPCLHRSFRQARGLFSKLHFKRKGILPLEKSYKALQITEGILK